MRLSRMPSFSSGENATMARIHDTRVVVGSEVTQDIRLGAPIPDRAREDPKTGFSAVYSAGLHRSRRRRRSSATRVSRRPPRCRLLATHTRQPSRRETQKSIRDMRPFTLSHVSSCRLRRTRRETSGDSRTRDISPSRRNVYVRAPRSLPWSLGSAPPASPDALREMQLTATREVSAA